MATVERARADLAMSPPEHPGPWARWWRAGTGFDRGFVGLSTVLIGTGYYDSWVVRMHPIPEELPKWVDVPVQAAWLALSLYMVCAAVFARHRERTLRSLVPEGYELSAAGCVVFLIGILLSEWWKVGIGPEVGVPAIFKVPNLLQIASGVLIVAGPLRASAARGELVAGPTALVSAVLLLAAVTFFTQFDHPYIDQYALTASKRMCTLVLPCEGVILPGSGSSFDLYNYREQILGALGLLMQTGAVAGVLLWTLRQHRLPLGSVTLMLTVVALLAATQYGPHLTMILVGGAVGVLADLALWQMRPRADRVWHLHLFAGGLGALLAGAYFAAAPLGTGTWWQASMIFGTIFACALLGALISCALFPDTAAMRAASVLWPAVSPESPSDAPDVTLERVEHALKVLHSPRDLLDSPLIGMRCLSSPMAMALQETIMAAIEHLRSSTFYKDFQAGQILDLYYVRRIGGHYMVWTRLGLSKAAYFNRRSYGIQRLADRLRDLEEAALTS